MNVALLIAGLLTVAVGAAHSFLGERLILGPLFDRGEMPPLLGSTTFARQTLRWAWHLTTVLMVVLGAWFGALAFSQLAPQTIWSLRLFSGMFVFCGIGSLIGARGKHFSWYVFLAIAVALWLGAARG